MSHTPPTPRAVPAQPDVLAAAEPFVQQCGPCDYGVIEVGCNCPPGDYRHVMVRLMGEVERLRAARPAAHLLPLLDLTADELNALVRAAGWWADAAAAEAIRDDQPDDTNPNLHAALDKLTTTDTTEEPS